MSLETDRRSFMKMFGVLGLAAVMPKEVVAAALALDQATPIAEQVLTGLRLSSKTTVFNADSLEMMSLSIPQGNRGIGAGSFYTPTFSLAPATIECTAFAKLDEIANLRKIFFELVDAAGQIVSIPSNFYSKLETRIFMGDLRDDQRIEMLTTFEQVYITDMQDQLMTFSEDEPDEQLLKFDAKFQIVYGSLVTAVAKVKGNVIAEHTMISTGEGFKPC